MLHIAKLTKGLLLRRSRCTMTALLPVFVRSAGTSIKIFSNLALHTFSKPTKYSREICRRDLVPNFVSHNRSLTTAIDSKQTLDCSLESLAKERSMLATLTLVASKCSKKQYDHYPPTYNFNFIPDDRWTSVDEILLDSIYHWACPYECVSYVVNGARGSGKSIFCMELIRLFKERIPMIRPKDKDAKEFAVVLEKSRTLYISFGQQGLNIDEHQVTKLSPEVILGLRVAWAYWFEDIDPSSFLEAAMELPDVHKFSLTRVISMISNEKNVTCLHLVFDDYDLIPSSLLLENEPSVTKLNYALLYALQNSIRIIPMLVLCTWCGTGFLDDRMRLTSYSDRYTVQRVYLPPLTTDSVSSIIGQIWGDDWEKTVSPQLQNLAGFFGGLPKCAEALGAKTSFQNTTTQITRKFESNVAFASSEAGLIPYLALSGCPVSPGDNVGGDNRRKVKYFETKGDITFHAFSLYYNEGVIGMPLIFVWHHLSKVSPLYFVDYYKHDMESHMKELAEELKNGLDSMTFQRLSLQVLALRFNTAIFLAKINGMPHLNIDDLFGAAYRHYAMSDLRFELPLFGRMPLTHASSISTFKEKEKSKPQIIITAPSSDFAGVIVTNESRYRKDVMFWIDADNSMDTETLQVDEVLKKMDKIIEVKKKMPDQAHILVIITTQSIGINEEVKKLLKWPQKFHENVVLVNQGQPYTIKLSDDQIEAAERTLIMCKENFHTAYSAVLAPLL